VVSHPRGGHYWNWQRFFCSVSIMEGHIEFIVRIYRVNSAESLLAAMQL
jgi:hypothetical protein